MRPEGLGNLIKIIHLIGWQGETEVFGQNLPPVQLCAPRITTAVNVRFLDRILHRNTQIHI
jgi:hypothetical protein